MKPYFRPLTRQSQKGSVAVEAAVCIAFILTPLLFFIFSFGRFFWHYTVVQKALHDATLYMAKAPLGEVRNGAAEQLAVNFIMDRETADLDSGTTLTRWTQCGFRQNSTSVSSLGFGPCNTQNLAIFAVRTNAVMTVPNPFYFGSNQSGGISFFLISTMRHAGN